jgi:hypothetical protein
MWSAVQFDPDITLHAEEIQHVFSNTVLPAEFLAEDLSPVKVFPKKPFGGCAIIAEFSSTVFEWRNVDEVEVAFTHGGRSLARF